MSKNVIEKKLAGLIVFKIVMNYYSCLNTQVLFRMPNCITVKVGHMSLTSQRIGSIYLKKESN